MQNQPGIGAFTAWRALRWLALAGFVVACGRSDAEDGELGNTLRIRAEIVRISADAAGAAAARARVTADSARRAGVADSFQLWYEQMADQASDYARKEEGEALVARKKYEQWLRD